MRKQQYDVEELDMKNMKRESIRQMAAKGKNQVLSYRE